jgi:hypothetical protein
VNVPSPRSWRQQVLSGLVVVVAVAVGARVAWEVLAPLVPTALVLIGLLGLFSLLIGRWRR